MKTLLVIAKVFPTQFKAVVNACSSTHRIVALCHKANLSQIKNQNNLILYHDLPFGGFEANVITYGDAIRKLIRVLAESNIKIDLLLIQASFGFEVLLNLLPSVPIIGYFETYYREEFTQFNSRKTTEQIMSAIHTNELQSHFASKCSLMITPTRFQRHQFPSHIKNKMFVIHEGIETEYFCPLVTADQEIKTVTYVATGLEPAKGFMQFVHIMKLVMEDMSNVRVEIAGLDQIFYNMYDDAYPEVRSYKTEAIKVFGQELMKRVRFHGMINKDEILKLYQRSDLHVHFTVIQPSWSLLEAMSCGCVVLLSNNGGLLDEFSQYCIPTNHDDYIESKANVIRALSMPPEEALNTRKKARKYIMEYYQAKTGDETWQGLVNALL